MTFLLYAGANTELFQRKKQVVNSLETLNPDNLLRHGDFKISFYFP